MASNLIAMASSLVAMASIAMASSLVAMASIAMASNLIAVASNPIAMTSNLIAMASNLVAMASTLIAMASNRRNVVWLPATCILACPVHLVNCSCLTFCSFSICPPKLGQRGGQQDIYLTVMWYLFSATQRLHFERLFDLQVESSPSPPRGRFRKCWECLISIHVERLGMQSPCGQLPKAFSSLKLPLTIRRPWEALRGPVYSKFLWGTLSLSLSPSSVCFL